MSILCKACLASALVLWGPAIAIAQEGSPQTAPPAERIAAILAEQQQAMQEFMKAYQAATTDEERQKLVEQKYPKPDGYAKRIVEIALTAPKDPGVVDGLVFVIQGTQGSDKKRAIEILKSHHIEAEGLGMVCLMMSYDISAESMAFVRQVREASPHSDVKAKATFALAAMLERSNKPEEARLLYEEVIAKYADVEGMGGPLGDSAKSALFEMDHLSVGKVAPDIEGQDVDGVAFKLSDYRGKVVFLDFWGDW